MPERDDALSSLKDYTRRPQWALARTRELMQRLRPRPVCLGHGLRSSGSRDIVARERNGYYRHRGSVQQLAGDGAERPVQTRVRLVADHDGTRSMTPSRVAQRRDRIVV